MSSHYRRYVSPYSREAWLKRKRRALVLKIGVAAGAVALIGGVVSINVGIVSSSKEVRTCTVTSKDHSVDKSGSGVYRIYTDQCDVLSVEDSLFTGTYNSASIYGQIREGHTYQFTTVGTRNPFFSLFPHITAVKEAN